MSIRTIQDRMSQTSVEFNRIIPRKRKWDFWLKEFSCTIGNNINQRPTSDLLPDSPYFKNIPHDRPSKQFRVKAKVSVLCEGKHEH